MFGIGEIFHSLSARTLSFEFVLNMELDMEEVKKTTKKYPNGNTMKECWKLNRVFHREDGPAYKVYNVEGTLEKDEWCLHGLTHCETGPAKSNYIEGTAEYWLNGEKLSKLDWIETKEKNMIALRQRNKLFPLNEEKNMITPKPLTPTKESNMINGLKDYINKNQESIYTIMFIIMIDHFFLRGALRTKIQSTCEGLLNTQLKKVESNEG